MDNEVRNVFGLSGEEFNPKSSKELKNSKFSSAETVLKIMKVINVLLSIAMGGFWYFIGETVFGRYAEGEAMFFAIIGGIINLLVGWGIILLHSIFIDMCRDVSAMREKLENN